MPSFWQHHLRRLHELGWGAATVAAIMGVMVVVVTTAMTNRTIIRCAGLVIGLTLLATSSFAGEYTVSPLYPPTAAPPQYLAPPSRPGPPPPFDDKWQAVEADNGAITLISMATLTRGPSGATATINESDNGKINWNGFHRLVFDCEGHVVDTGPWVSIPSRSVMARVAQIVCDRPIRPH